MFNSRTPPAKICSFIKTALLKSSKPKCTCIPHRFYSRPLNQTKSLSKFITQISGTSFVCGATAYYLADTYFKSNRFIVNAIERVDEDRPNAQSYNFLADIIEKAQPAVVFIEVTMRHPYGNAMVKSHGSGFIVREDGLILTNAHVVSRQSTVNVKLQGGRVVKGEVQAVDTVTDLATIKVNETNLPTLKLGNSSSSRPGEFVIAMGSPLTLNNTVTHGIISSVHRGSDELGMHNRDMEYIQTDAVITKGNSGGPLVNMKGEAIGINTLNMMSGISFAIPSDRAAEFLKKAEELEKRTSSKGWFGMKNKATKQGRYLGITMFTLSPDFLLDLQARISNFPQNITAGVLVQTVVHGSPAHRAGLEPADVIIKINGVNVKSSEDVYKIVESSDTLTVEIARHNQRHKFTVTPDLID